MNLRRSFDGALRASVLWFGFYGRESIPMSNTNFYADMAGFSDFTVASSPAHYHPVPHDWVVVLSDVEGSTKAIEQGRYKDVNMVGAACITAVVNACEGIDIPYVFGGDGATMLVPAAQVEQVTRSLLSLKQRAQAMHQLHLRIGIVPVSEITARGKRFEVAKYLMPTGCALAMFRGGGANLADDLVKHGGFSIEEAHDEQDSANLEGLSCRWRPISAKHDTMLTLLVMSRHSGAAEKDEYAAINRFISESLGTDAQPVHEAGLHYHWPGLETLRHCQMVWRQGKTSLNLLGHVFIILLFRVLDRLGKKVGDFDVKAYKQDMLTNCDYRKFDDMLRMVVDCTHAEAEIIEAKLAQLQAKGEIYYGTHYSQTALMTCFVMSTASDKHVHFVDGGDGGYALAAKQLKAQIATDHQRSSALPSAAPSTANSTVGA